MRKRNNPGRNHRVPWSEDEKQYVESRYLTDPVEDIADALGRTSRAIGAMYYKLNAPLKQERWSAEELALIQDRYRPESDPAELCPYLPGRTETAIKAMAADLGLQASAPFWTKAELRLLQRHYPTEGTRIAKQLIGRTPAGIRNQAHKMGLRYIGGQHYQPWTNEEKHRLCKLQHLNQEELLSHFPGRSINSLLGARRRLRPK